MIGLQNELRLTAEKLSQTANNIFERLRGGAEIEPGLHEADFGVRCAGGRYSEVLRIDGHELP